MNPALPSGALQAGSSSSQPPPLWKVLLPLVLLVIPAGMVLAADHLPLPWSYWLRVAAAVCAGVVLLWVLVRLALYLHRRLIAHRQQTFLRRQDPLYAAAVQIQARVRKALERQRQAGLGPYYLPWYLVLGEHPEQVEAFLRGSGLEFPPGSEDDLNLQAEQPDRWFLANQAVLVDTSAVGSLADGERQFDLLLEALARLRPCEPINGVILLLGVEELADPEAAQEVYGRSLARLRRIQRILALNFPVYLAVAGLDRLPGFPDFFGDLSGEGRDQILGWSEGRDPGQPFDQGMFRKGLARLREALATRLHRRLGQPLEPPSAGRALVFFEELETFLEVAREAGENIFAPNRYLDPLPLRGLFLVATGAEGPGVSLRASRQQVATHLLPPGVAGDGSWFVAHLFPHKILPERGLLSRPRWVRRRQLWRKAVAGALLLLVVAGGSWWLADTVGQARRVEGRLEPALRAARVALAGRSDPATALRLGQALLAQKQWLESRPLSRRLLGAWRYASLARELGEIHRALYYRLFLSDYLRRVESALSQWSGQGDFPRFARALEEYVRWANPYTSAGDLEIAPLVDFLGAGLEERERILGQFQDFREEGGLELPRPVGLGAQALVERCLHRLRVYLNPTLGGASQLAASDDARWWLVFSRGLDRLYQSYLSLLLHSTPTRQVSYQQTRGAFAAASQALGEFHRRLQGLQALVSRAAGRDVGWVDAERLLSALGQAAWGWKAVERELALTRQAAQSYRRRVLAPMASRLYLVPLLAGAPGYDHLRGLLQTSLGDRADLVLSPAAWQVGYQIRLLMVHLEDYRQRLARWQDWSAGSRPGGPAAPSLEDTVRLLRQELGQVEQARMQVMQDLARLKQMTPAAGASRIPGEERAHLASGLGKLLDRGGKGSPASGAVSREMLALYRWDRLEPWTKQWLAAGERIGRYHAARAWQNLALSFHFDRRLLAPATWRQVKALPLFDLGDPGALVQPVERFLAVWRQQMPPTLASLANPAQALRVPPELQEFLALKQALDGFALQELPALRKAAARFVRCVQQMDADPGAAWRQIRDTAGPGGGGDQELSWGALEALGEFARAARERYGSAVDMIVRPLEAMGVRVEAVFRQAVVAGFQRRWQDLLAAYARQGLDRSFPFAPRGRRPLDYRRLEAFLSQLEGLARDYRLLPHPNPDPAASTRLYAAARETVAQLASRGRRRFLRRCLALRNLLLPPPGGKQHQVVLHLVPGEIGRSLHWVRLRLGDGTVYDLSVYGTPKVKVPLPARGPITFLGLDVRKTPLSSWQAARVGLIQLPYAHGHSQDPLRRKWLVEGSLPAVDRPGVRIPFRLVMEFDQSLPPLPLWPEE